MKYFIFISFFSALGKSPSYDLIFVLFKNVFYITEVCYLKKYFLPLKNFFYETKACNKKITAIMKKNPKKINIEKLSVEFILTY